MQAQWQILALAAAAGCAIGLAYYGGLWWTARRLPLSSRPGLLAAGSLLARMALALGGLYLVMAGSPLRLAAALAGMLVVRVLLTRRLGPAGPGGARA